MGWLKDVFGSGGTPPARPSSPSTRDREKATARKVKEDAARKERSRRHKFLVSRGESDPFD